MKSIYILIFSVLVCFSACRVKEGDLGLPGESALNKQGSVSGTLNYYKADGDTAIVPFSFEYFPTAQQSEFFYVNDGSRYYNFYISRQEAKEDESYVELTVEGEALDAVTNLPATPQYMDMYFSITKLVNGKLFVFRTNYTINLNGGSSTADISNFKMDTIGNLSFNYEIEIDPNSIDYYYRSQDHYSTPATLKGKVDVVLPRTYYNSIYSSLKATIPSNGL